jgi:hypothetical protein
MNPTVYTEDGMVYHFRPNIVNIEDDATKTYYVIASTIEDRNGNTMTYTTDTSGADRQQPLYGFRAPISDHVAASFCELLGSLKVDL